MEDFDFNLDDIVMFELPKSEHVDAFCDRFRPRWQGWSDEDGDVWLFTARLETTDSVAPLLREAQELIGELGLAAIRFCFDGRVYVLEAAATASADDLAVKSK